MTGKSPARSIKKSLVLALFIVLLLMAFSSCASPGQPGSSGISGIVMIGPVPSTDKEGKFDVEPYPDATIFVMDPSGTEKIAEIKTDEEGHFKIDLAPGRYLLVPQTPKDQILPTGEPREVVVRQKGFTDVILYYDSGIR